MALKDYNKAFRYGKKEYESRLLAGRKPTLESLDEILPDEALSTESLGLVQIPIDQIVGTRYSGRSSAFASNFMPILESNTEFAIKWAKLSGRRHRDQGGLQQGRCRHELWLLGHHQPLRRLHHCLCPLPVADRQCRPESPSGPAHRLRGQHRTFQRQPLPLRDPPQRLVSGTTELLPRQKIRKRPLVLLRDA